MGDVRQEPYKTHLQCVQNEVGSCSFIPDMYKNDFLIEWRGHDLPYDTVLQC